jgi:tetratricopeptide (TPR) repeat protein
MASAHPQPESPRPQSLAELFTDYLRQRVASRTGLALGEAPAAGEVVPYDASPVPPVDPRLAWDEAQAAVQHYPQELRAAPVPPEWATLVQSQEPVAAVAYCLGNYPQMVRDLHGLLEAQDLAALRLPAGRPVPVPELSMWADASVRQRQFPQALQAVGALRLAKQYERSAELFQELQAHVPDGWQTATANEQAALAWHSGRADEAARLWNAQPDSAPVLFNRGLAALFLSRPAEARPWLAQAAEQLPEDGAWHHLGRLYLALAEMRRA